MSKGQSSPEGTSGQGQLLADDEEAAALIPTKADPVPVQVQAKATSKDIGDTTLTVPALDGATKADDRSLHTLLGVGLVIGHGLSEVRQADVAPTFDSTEDFLGSRLVVIFEVLVGHLSLTLASDRKMLRTQAVGHEDVLIAVDATVDRIIVLDQHLAELPEDEDLQVIGQ